VAFFKEIGDGDWRVSLRSKGNVDIGAIARAHGGGGHTNAAGCGARGSIDEIFRQFGELLSEAIRNK
jgi:phosphoesterase RecJ-like protein